jgi:hypothetical protein
MATEIWPTGDPAFRLLQYDEGLEWNVQVSAGRAGNVTTRSLPGIRWLGALYIPPETVANDIYRGRVEALIAKLDGGENRLAMFNLARPVPNGTLRGSPTISGAHATGVSSIVLANCTGYDNLLLHSQAFDNAYWTKANATVTANAGTAPDGAAAAEALVENTANSTHGLTRAVSVAAGGSLTAALYVKRGAGTRHVRIDVLDSGTNGCRALFNLDTGAVHLTQAVGTGTVRAGSASVTAVGSGWYRITVGGTLAVASTTATMYVYMLDSLTSGTAGYIGDGASSLLVWGAQLSQSDKLYPYAAGATLLRGDRISAVGQRFMVASDAMADSAGAMTVQVRPRVRVAFVGGEAVVWDKPTSLFIPTTPRVMFPYKADQRPGFAVEVAEVWA